MLESTSSGPADFSKLFHPVYVASGTDTSGIISPAISLPSLSTVGTRIGNADKISGGSTVVIPRVRNSGPYTAR